MNKKLVNRLIKKNIVSILIACKRFICFQKECPRCYGKGWIYVPFGKDDVDADECPMCEQRCSISIFARRKK